MPLQNATLLNCKSFVSPTSKTWVYCREVEECFALTAWWPSLRPCEESHWQHLKGACDLQASGRKGRAWRRWKGQTSPWDMFHKGCKALFAKLSTLAPPNQEHPVCLQRYLFFWWPSRSWPTLKPQSWQGKNKNQFYAEMALGSEPLMVPFICHQILEKFNLCSLWSCTCGWLQPKPTALRQLSNWIPWWGSPRDWVLSAFPRKCLGTRAAQEATGKALVVNRKLMAKKWKHLLHIDRNTRPLPEVI